MNKSKIKILIREPWKRYFNYKKRPNTWPIFQINSFNLFYYVKLRVF